MEQIKQFGQWVLIALAVIGVIAAAMLVVYLGISVFWIFAAAGFVM